MYIYIYIYLERERDIIKFDVCIDQGYESIRFTYLVSYLLTEWFTELHFK